MNGDTRPISVVVRFNARDDVLGIILDVQLLRMQRRLE